MVEFFLKEDLVESTIINSDTTINIESAELKKRFIDGTNRWYTKEALELGVAEDNVMVYDPTVDVEDNRNDDMIELCEYHYLMNVFFSLWKKGDDIFEKKYDKVEVKFNNQKSLLSKNRIIGISPATIKTTNGFATIKRRRGEA